MTKIVVYDTLIPDVADIQPNIAWLLAHVPDLVFYHNTEGDRERVTEVLEDLQLKCAKLQGKVLELEANVVELEEGSVTVALPEEETDDDLAYAEEALRSALAEVIVQRGEQRLEKGRVAKNRKYAGLYGGNPCGEKILWDGNPGVEWRFTEEDIQQFKALSASYTSLQDAIEQTQIECEEAEAFKAAKATVTELGADEVPDIDLDGQPLD